MEGNQLCGLDDGGHGEYTTAGITELCEGLKGSSVTSLRCALGRAFAFLSMPVDTSALSPSLSHPSLGSLRGNDLDDEGVSALAAVLKETKIVSLECAAAPECSLSRQRPLTPLSTRLCSHARSLAENELGSEGGAALAEGLKGNTTLQSLR